MRLDDIDRHIDDCIKLFKDDPAMLPIVEVWEIHKRVNLFSDEVETLKVLVLGMIRVLIKHGLLKEHGHKSKNN